MAGDWYAQNSGRNYPLVGALWLNGSPSSFEVESAIRVFLLDAGFCLGAGLEAPADEPVRLVRLVRAAGQTELRFDAAGQTVDFSVPTDGPAGMPRYEENGGLYGFVVTGDPAELISALPEGTYVVTDGRVEPSQVRSEAGYRVLRVGFANLPGVRLPPCEEGSEEPYPDGPVTVLSDVDTELIFSEGYNCAIAVLPTRNQLSISALTGAGRGVVCEMPDRVPGLPQDPDGCECDSVLYTVSGVSPGPSGDLPVRTGPGVSVGPGADPHTLVVRIDERTAVRVCGPEG